MIGASRIGSANPMVKNASALMVSTISTSVLGVAFWALAARTYAPRSVGLMSAEISAMTLLANFAQLNMINVLPRFLPTSGSSVFRLLAKSYAACISLSFFIASAFVIAGFGSAFLKGADQKVLFVFAVAMWTIFTIQDAAMTGLRGTVWVPVENASFSVVKIALLPAFLIVLPTTGIFLAWLLPVVVALFPVNWYVFRRLAPGLHAVSNGRSRLPNRRDLGTFIAGEYVGSLAYFASIALLPLLVLSRLGATANAYFYTSWIVATSLELLLSNIATSLIVEASSDTTTTKSHVEHAIRLVLFVVLPLAAIGALFAPVLLSFLGKAYALHGTTLLRLVAISMPFRAVVVLYLATARINRRIRRVVTVQVVNAFFILSLALLFLSHFGVVGVGLAYLSTQTLMALAVLPSVIRQFRSWSGPTASTVPVPVIVDGAWMGELPPAERVRGSMSR
jgi:O-antigen/teichoic acid export membrane protein